jgi:hypothetical protein
LFIEVFHGADYAHLYSAIGPPPAHELNGKISWKEIGPSMKIYMAVVWYMIKALIRLA